MSGYREADGAQDGRMPSPEVLGRELTAGDLTQVVVDVVALDVDPSTGFAKGKQLFATAAPAFESAHELAHFLVCERLHALLAALGAVVERHDAGGAADVVAAHGRETVGLVLLGVLLAADAE